MDWRKTHFDAAGRPRLPNSEWPADLAVERIEAISQNARATWFALLGLLTFVLVTLLGVEDIDFFGFGRETQLPLIGVSVPTVFFFIAAPILTAAVYAYFHFYLMKLWDALGRAPARIGGDALGDRIHPWLVSDAALLLRAREGAAPKRALRWVSALTSAALTWGFGWIVLGVAWAKALPAHDEWLSLLILGCLLFSVWIGLTSLIVVKRRVGQRDYADKSHIVWRTWPRRIAIGVTLMGAIALTWIKTEGGVEDYLPQNFVELAKDVSDLDAGITNLWLESTEDRRKRHENALPVWMTTSVLGTDNPDTFQNESLSGVLSPADLFEAQLTEKPSNWLDRESAEKAARRKWCSRRDMTWALCVKTPDDQQTALRDAWCRQPVSDDLDRGPAACAQYFVDAESAFQAEWKNRRDDYLSVLKKPNLEGADLRGANLANAFLPDIDMEGARLQGANLQAARLEDVTLVNAQMQGADLWRAQMQGADLRGAQMQGAVLWEAQLKSADLSGVTIGPSPLRSVDFTSVVGLTQNQLEQAIGNSGENGDPPTILPLDADTGEPLYVWSCWEAAPETLPGPPSMAEYYQDQLETRWLCKGEPRIKTGLSSATGFRQGFSLTVGRGL